MTKRWYVVHAYSGFEKSVQRALIERVSRAGMQDAFGQMVEFHPRIGHQFAHFLFAVKPKAQHHFAVATGIRRQAIAQEQKPPADHVRVGRGT